MAKHQDVSTGLYLVAMVGIVAVIGLVVLVMNSGSSATYDYDDLTGQGYAFLAAGCTSLVGSGATLEMYDSSSRSWVPVAVRQRGFGSEEPVGDQSTGSSGDGYDPCDAAHDYCAQYQLENYDSCMSGYNC